ncbi:hypothetical protein B0I21_11183 [Sphingobacterium paludis]|uniref:Uncharacterized protein n=1 Tax=Sphingobacterium paludis TaxID=1476465 RepID=A0A4R7CRG0_9SPHI|nr:hypothetical protein B0I21_11183 [Sphingobacterium paludis]
MLFKSFAFVIALSGPFMTLLMSGFDVKKVMFGAIFMFTDIISSFDPHTEICRHRSIHRVKKRVVGPLKSYSFCHWPKSVSNFQRRHEMTIIVFLLTF